MNIEIMISHYKKTFRNPKHILDWIEHDLRHMGLEPEQIELELNKTLELLKGIPNENSVL